MQQNGLQPGGRYEPSECRSRHKLAIIVRYRDRAKHLAVFLRYMHPFLQRQQLNYTIFVIEQIGKMPAIGEIFTLNNKKPISFAFYQHRRSSF